MAHMTRTEGLERLVALLTAEACGKTVKKDELMPYGKLILECVEKYQPELARGE